MDASIAQVDRETRARLLDQARLYNDTLAGKAIDGAAGDLLPYGKQLSPDGRDTAFGYVTIPKIGLSMPIYRGTDDAALSAGVGHLEGTSLPVGGASTHAVLTAHSGLEGMRAFDDIRKLEPGDVFGVKVLGDMRCYRVVGSQTVLPDQATEFGDRAGRGPLHVAHLHALWSKYTSSVGARGAMRDPRWISGRRVVAVRTGVGACAPVACGVAGGIGACDVRAGRQDAGASALRPGRRADRGRSERHRNGCER